jgi:hypothetical protein
VTKNFLILRLNKILIVSIVFLIGFSNSFGQEKQIKEPYYMFPIQPGIQNYLAGTMGELRSSHFHAGLDIKTGGVEGLPVYAAADGYISRIAVSAGGYGNALYIQHPNGTTTVYAHLQKFKDEIAQFVKNEQYKKESFEVDLYTDKTKFIVKKGEQIALSGNSGSSGGPHLHFEIRDANQNLMDPLTYNFSEIKDNIAPIIQKVAFVTLDKNARINGQFGRFEFNVTKYGDGYALTEPISAYGRIGMEIMAYDKINGSENKTGIKCKEVLLDNQQVFYQSINTFSFGDSKNIYIHTNYAAKVKTGNTFSKLYVDNGNSLQFYKTNNDKGYLIIKDSLEHQVKVSLWDSYSNSSTLTLTLKGSKPKSIIKAKTSPYKGTSGYELHQNVLLAYSEVVNGIKQNANIYANGKKYEVVPDYLLNNHAVFLWNLNAALPDSMEFCDQKQVFSFKARVPSDDDFNFYNDHMELSFSKASLFDTIFLNVKRYLQKESREIFEVNDNSIPLRNAVGITLKPSGEVMNKAKAAVYAVDDKGNTGFEGGAWNGNSISFRTRNLGKFTILSDTISPQIKVVKITPDRASFKILDNLSGVKSYRATLDGKWLLMHYDRKNNLIWSETKDGKPLKGELKLVVSDNMGNEIEFSHRF